MANGMMIAKAARMRAKKMAEGGMAKDDVAEPVSKNAEAMQKGATKSGYDPQSWAQNFKEGLKMAKGGTVNKDFIDHPEELHVPHHAYSHDEDLADIRYNEMSDKVDQIPEPKSQSFAKGGVVHAIMERRKAKMMAEGGMAEDSLHENDEFLTADMDPMEADDELAARTYPDPDETEDPEMKRKMRISSIMGGLASKHYGK